MNKTDEFVKQKAQLQKFGDKAMETFAKDNYVPIIRPASANFLRTIVAIKQPKNILEIGTAIGYSGKLMLDACESAKLTTLEIDFERYEIAQKNLKKYKERVDFKLCDAGDYLLNCEEKFDLIFLDGAKAQYLSYYPSLMTVLNDGGVLVADNVLQDGMTTGETVVKHKLESTIDRMNVFLDKLCKNKELMTTIVPLEDGLCVCYKCKRT